MLSGQAKKLIPQGKDPDNMGVIEAPSDPIDHGSMQRACKRLMLLHGQMEVTCLVSWEGRIESEPSLQPEALQEAPEAAQWLTQLVRKPSAVL